MAHTSKGRIVVWIMCTLASVGCTNTPAGDGAIGTQVYFDDFDGAEAWIVDEDFDRRYYYAGGRYFVDANNGTWWANAPYSRAGFAGDLALPYGVSVEATVLLDSAGQEAAASIVFEYQDGDNWMQFLIDEVGAYKVREQRGGQNRDLTDWTSNGLLFDAGTPNTIRINRYADRVEIFANGRGLRTIRTPALSTRRTAGIGATTFTGMTSSAAFDNFGLHQIDTP